MSNQAAESPSSSNRPVEKIRLGLIQAAIWRNETNSGLRHNVSFERIYREGNDWRSTNSFGRDDLLLLSKIADQAHTWIIQAERELRTNNRGAEEVSALVEASVL